MPLTPVDQALQYLLASLPAAAGHELASLGDAAGRVLARDLTAAIDVPPHAASAMDGYAVRSADVRVTPVSLKVSRRVAAGQVAASPGTQEAARIFTGAPLPTGCDAVVMQENCTLDGDVVTIRQSVAAGENVRAMGEDLRKGQRLLTAGRRLRPQDIGLAASTGLVEVPLRPRLKVAFISTGDELALPGDALAPGMVYDSNRFTLPALLKSLPVDVVSSVSVGDDPGATGDALASAARSADCVISTGGVSVGEEDHVKAALQRLGALELWKLAIKPGKPFASGKVLGKQFFGLPGNPVSAFVTFVVLVRPCLLRMQGCTDISPRHFAMESAFALPRSGERRQYLRVSIDNDAARPVLRPFDNQSSGAGASLSAADGLAIIPPQTTVKAGDSLAFIPFSELLA